MRISFFRNADNVKPSLPARGPSPAAKHDERRPRGMSHAMHLCGTCRRFYSPSTTPRVRTTVTIWNWSKKKPQSSGWGIYPAAGEEKKKGCICAIRTVYVCICGFFNRFYAMLDGGLPGCVWPVQVTAEMSCIASGNTLPWIYLSPFSLIAYFSCHRMMSFHLGGRLLYNPANFFVFLYAIYLIVVYQYFRRVPGYKHARGRFWPSCGR